MFNPICKLCNSGTSFHFFKIGFDFYECNQCGFIFIHPVPDEGIIQDQYSKEYYENQARYIVPAKNNLEVWSRRIATIEKYLPLQKLKDEEKSILDIGCATGIFLEIARNSGWEIYGIEYSDYSAKLAADKLGEERIQNTNFEGYESPRKLTAITAWAVIEHVSAPKSFLEKANMLLEENGILAFSTVNTSSLNGRLFKKRWRYFNPPEHLSFFNLNNIRRILNDTGFDLLEYKTNFVYKNFLAGILKIPPDTPNLLTKSILIPLKIFSQSLSLGDVIEIWARKK
jgi:2-polyprenyl-3-methyl-5-hydroxy-6-metoxy-1,4-benzoquinol methylase